MPLRDHFRSPLADRRSWEGIHGQWPAMIVLTLNPRLPRRYVAEPQIHLGSSFEIVSPTNKDPPEHRRAFVAKCTALLQNRVSVAIVDLVTIRDSNLYSELLELSNVTDRRCPPNRHRLTPPPVAVREAGIHGSWRRGRILSKSACRCHNGALACREPRGSVGAGAQLRTHMPSPENPVSLHVAELVSPRFTSLPITARPSW